MKKRFFLLFMLIIFLLMSCLSKVTRPDETELIDFEDFKLSLVYEPTQLRIDLVRQMDSHSSSNHDGTSSSHFLPRPYEFIGVNIGNGIVIDANMNIFLDVFHLLNLKPEEDYRILSEADGFMFSEKVKLIKKAHITTIDSKSSFLENKIKIENFNDYVDIKHSLFNLSYSLDKKENDKLFYRFNEKQMIPDTEAIFIDNNQVKINNGPHGLVDVRLINANKVIINNTITIEQIDKKIKFSYTIEDSVFQKFVDIMGNFSATTITPNIANGDYYLVKTNDILHFYMPEKNDYTNVKLMDNEMLIDSKKGKKQIISVEYLN